jgi:PAS domain S-box-containing protein
MLGWRTKTYSQIFDNISSGIYVVDHQQRIKYWNRAAEKLTGITAEEISGKPFLDIGYEDVQGDALQSFEYPVSLCFQKKTVISKNFVFKGKDGLNIAVEESAAPILEKGDVTGVIVTFRDVSGLIQSVTDQLKSERKEKLIPICGWCKKIRSDENYWEKLETYLTNEGFGVFTHGMCPACADKIFEKKIYLESFQDICKSISASISLDEVLQLIVTNVVKVMNVKASLLRLLNKETEQLEIAAYFGLSEKYANKGPVAYDASIDDAIAGKPVSVYDITEHKDSRYYQEALEEGIRSILSIPLRFAL